MYSFGFPKMLNSNTSNLIIDKEAIRSNLYLLLRSERLTLFGDPYFGIRLKHVLFEQSTSIIPDLVIDEIYTTILTFMPQVFLTRKDITLTTDGVDVFANIKLTYVLDNTSDLYTINLTTGE